MMEHRNLPKVVRKADAERLFHGLYFLLCGQNRMIPNKVFPY